MINTVHNIDCMQLLKDTPDKYYQLAIVDPPYGIGLIKDEQTGNWGLRKNNNGLYAGRNPDWDFSKPSKEYISELFRVSRNQILFGANHYIDVVSINSPCWLVWDKQNGDSYFADCELAWTSFKTATKKINLKYFGANSHRFGKRIHPTQKPVALYKWIISKYANDGDHILDTHVGSGSSRIAAYDAGLDFTGCELDHDYWLAQEKRFNNHIRQIRLEL